MQESSNITSNGKDAILVGEPFYNDGTYTRGRVHQMEVSGTTFTKTQEVLGLTDQNNTAFGGAVEYFSSFKYGSCSTAGPTLAVGRPKKVVNASERGSVSLYQLTGSTWSLCDTIDAATDDPTNGNYGQRIFNLGDIDKDGTIEELAIATQNWSGGAIRIYGGSSGVLLKSYRDTTNNLQKLGYVVAPAGDFDSDGNSELLISAPGAKINGQWGAGISYIFDWSSLDSTDNNTGTTIRTITGKPENGAYHGAGYIPIKSDYSSIHNATSAAIISRPGRYIDGVYSVGSFHEFSLIKMAPSLPSRIAGSSTNAKFGSSVVAIPDVDGDSVSDFIIGEPGGICDGRPYGAISIYSVLDGKINSQVCEENGSNKLGMGAEWLSSASHLLMMKKGNTYAAHSNNLIRYRNINDSTDYPTTRYTYDMDWEYPVMSPPYKVDNSTDEILFSDFDTWNTAANQGRVTLHEYDWQFTRQCYYRGTVEDGYFGKSASFIADLNSDGVREIVIGAPGETVNSNKGRVYVLDGSRAAGACSSGDTLDIDDAHALTLFTIDADAAAIQAVLSGAGANDEFGSFVLGLPDYDGAGTAKAYLFVANSNMKYGSSAVTPQFFILRINSDNSITVMNHETGSSGSMLGGYAKLIDDVNGDSLQELAISAPGGVGRLGNTGHVRILSGAAIATTTSTDDLIQMLYNPEPQAGNFGISIEYGDITGDSLKDFVVGDDLFDSSSYQNSGAVFIFPMEPIQE